MSRNSGATALLHRFTEQLDAEVQEALDAARARRLAPFESVQRRCEYLLARYVDSSARASIAQASSAKTPWSCRWCRSRCRLEAVEPHLLDACLRQIQAAIETLRPFDGKPFGRKAIFGPGWRKVGKQVHRLGRRECVGAAGAGWGRYGPPIPDRSREPRGPGFGRDVGSHR